MSDEESGEDFSGAEEVVGEGGGGGNSIANSCGLLMTGVLLFFAALWFLSWNEKNYVCENNHIMYADTKAKEVGCNSKGVNNQFVFFACPFVQSSLQTFTMCTFNRQNIMPCAGQPPISFVSVAGAQDVEMVQCKEECETKTHKSGGRNVKTTTCRYKLDWSTEWVNTGDFRGSAETIEQGCPNFQLNQRQNPVAPTNLDMGRSSNWATDVQVGDPGASYTLNEELIEGLRPTDPVPLVNYSQSFTAAYKPLTQPWQRPLTVTTENLFVEGNYLVTCRQAMQLGCVRISFFQSDATQPSVLTKVSSGGATTKEDFPSSWGCEATPWQSIKAATMTKADMIQMLLDENKITTWIFRIVGLCACWLAVWCCFQPISAAVGAVGDCINMVPCGGYIEDFLTGIVDSVICALSCSIGCSCGLFVIAVTWIYMRPLIGCAILALCALLISFAVFMRCMATKKKRKPGRLLPGGGKGCPVDSGVARGFIEAARAEYAYGNGGAVQNFFDGGVDPEDQQTLARFEDHIRDARDPNQVISRLQADWGV